MLGQTDPVVPKTSIFNRFARSASAVTPSQKGQLTQIGSPLNYGYYAVQGHSTSSRSVPIEARMRLPISD